MLKLYQKISITKYNVRYNIANFQITLFFIFYKQTSCTKHHFHLRFSSRNLFQAIFFHQSYKIYSPTSISYFHFLSINQIPSRYSRSKTTIIDSSKRSNIIARFITRRNSLASKSNSSWPIPFSFSFKRSHGNLV